MNIWEEKITLTANERRRLNMYARMMYKWFRLFLDFNSQYQMTGFAYEMAIGYYGKLETMLYKKGLRNSYYVAHGVKEMAWKNAWYAEFGEVIVS